MASCSGTEHSRHKNDATPSEGTIIYHDAVAPSNAFNKRARYTRWSRVFTTADEDLTREGPQVQVFTGQLSRDAPTGRRGGSELVRRMFEHVEKKSGTVRLLDSERFADLWRRLEDAGLFKIPRSRLQKPPRDRSYFHVKANGQEWIFTRPELRAVVRDDPATKQREYWGHAKRALVAFENDM